MNVQLLLNHQINKSKWDACIKRSNHPLLTAQSWCLDAASPGWQALVANDYDAVMPLPILKKGPFAMMVQPMFVQQLGIFSNISLSQKQANEFYSKAKKKFLSLCLNQQNPTPEILNIKPLVNFILPLNLDYEDIRKGFSENCKRNIKKATILKHQFANKVTAKSFVEFSKNNAPYALTDKSWKTLEKIILEAEKNGCGFTLGLTNQKDQVIATAFFLKDEKRITFFSGTSSPEGIEKKAMFFIINHIIEKNCDNPIILDFEGSSVKNVARFYQSFGSITENYFIWEHPLTSALLKIRRLIKI